MSPRTRRRGPARQSLRVQGWLYTAINPLITALDREQQFLSSGNLTWRRFNRSTEFIQEPEGYLDANGETNLEDCLDDHPKIREALEHHAQLLREAIVAAGVAYDLLMESPPFAEAVRAGQQKYRLQQGERVGRLASDPLDELVPMAAERTVNEIVELSSAYVDWEFWTVARPVVLGAIHDELRPLQAARERLRADSSLILGRLRDLRKQLCNEYDLPPAPLPRF
ncbi:MAG: hypothetical protein AABZ30_01970 [Myxococcota bacterium]